MGVNPLSHFFAWFFECATYLTLTIVILTLILKHGGILPHSDGFLLFLYLCDYGLSILAFSYLVSSFFDKTYIAGLSGSLIYILCFFPFIVVMAVETKLTFSQKSVLVRNLLCHDSCGVLCTIFRAGFGNICKSKLDLWSILLKKIHPSYSSKPHERACLSTSTSFSGLKYIDKDPTS